ncbi:MAG: hypothetical protein HW397_153 [Dehalococcoidia bacterium]|nr:hypothetical protein [Dehalococcoidia bacterium]
MVAPMRRRFTIVELMVVVTLVGLLAFLAVPVLRDNGTDGVRASDQQIVQDALRLYHLETAAYPTHGPPAELPAEALVEPWSPGSIPTDTSSPIFAGLNFDAVAIKTASLQPVSLYPDYLRERPKYTDVLAADGTHRWRIDSKGDVHIEMDGRSY